MDIIEFAEKFTKRKLTRYEKWLLQFLEKNRNAKNRPFVNMARHQGREFYTILLREYERSLEEGRS